MAPITRNSQINTASRVPARKRATRSGREPLDSLDSRDEQQQQTTHTETNHHYNGDLVAQSREDLNFDVDQATNPLREMAARIGKEVEIFAENLDRFLGDMQDQNRFEATLDLVRKFKAIAQDTASKLQKDHKLARARRLRTEWSDQAGLDSQLAPLPPSAKTSAVRSEMTADKIESLEKMRMWEQEADIWELFRLVLQLYHNPDRHAMEEEKARSLRELGDVNCYTSEQDLWSRFLIMDDVAQQRHAVKKWLEDSAAHQESEVSSIMEELEARAGRGRGLWSQGWLHTRERIKGENRLRSWPSSPGAPLPHIKQTDTSELLVTTLDPDAVSRQQRTLEKPDAYFERATWIACWEMLRRGKTWDEVCGWCEQHKEGWRAISLGKATNSADMATNSLWRHACYVASQSGCSSDYEAAVYGLLGGSVTAVQKVCRDVDDMLYAHYNAALTRQFDHFLATCYPNRAPQARRGPIDDALRDPEQQIVDLTLQLRKQPTTQTEAVAPMKILQSYLLANDLENMVVTLGYATSVTETIRGGNEEVIVFIPNFWTGSDPLPEAEVALDHRTLRIAAHISILTRLLSTRELRGDARVVEENVLCAYIQALRAAGLRDLIPVYASRLSVGRCVVCISRVLEDITGATEQDTMLRLMHQYKLPVIMILNEHLWNLLNRYIAPRLRTPNPLRVLEKTDDLRLYPGQRIIAGFFPEEIDQQEATVLRSLQWFNMVQGLWQDTFQALAIAVRKCLVAGRIALALSIVTKFPYETMSIRKSYQVIGKSVNMMEHDGPAPANEASKWDLMKRNSRTYYELEHLVNAIKALSNWRKLEIEYTTDDNLNTSVAPADLKGAKDDVDYAMSHVLNGNILQHPLTAEEKADLDFIRRAYIPEIVIAYNTVLHTAGSIISRDSLIESMDLSVTIAKDDSKLAVCFMEAGRMRELVTSFAQTSKLMLVLSSAGNKQWKAKKEKEGKDLTIWEIGPQGEVADHDAVAL